MEEAKLFFCLLSPPAFAAWQDRQLAAAGDAEKAKDVRRYRRAFAAATYTPEGR